MPSRRHELLKLLNVIDQPVYVLDDEWRIVFCNRACADWTAFPADKLVGQLCRYHSESEAAGPAAAAASLCPPPDAIVPGQPAAGTISCATAEGRLSYRRAHFLPLSRDGDEPAALLVVASQEELARPDTGAPASRDAGSAELHDRLQRFRVECRGRRHVDRLVGDSPAMRQVRRQVALAAVGRSSVLVVGPVGSDRERVARAIHYSDSDPGSLVPLSCSLLPGELLHSTLAAVVESQAEQKPLATGTLLLGDVDQLPAELQVGLPALLAPAAGRLRVVGTSRETLDQLAARGEFRPGLAAELSTLVIRIPALPERLDDVPLLAQELLEEENSRGARQLAGFSREALDRLLAYRWPGDTSELGQVVRAACAAATGPEVTAGDLPERLRLAADAEAKPRRPEEPIVLEEFLGRIELELIQRALARAKGNKTKAAHLLGMTRPRLYRRLVQLGLVKEEDQVVDAE